MHSVFFIEKEKEFQERKRLRGEKDKPKKEAVAGGQEDQKDDTENKEDKKDEFRLPLGTVLKLEGLGEGITREDIKELLSSEFSVNIEKDGGDIAFITYERGGADARVSNKEY
jgi:hypothetical protein